MKKTLIFLAILFTILLLVGSTIKVGSNILADETNNVNMPKGEKEKEFDSGEVQFPVKVENLIREKDVFEGAGVDFQKDYVNKIPGFQFGYRLDTEIAGKSDIILRFQEPRDISKTSAIGMWIYLDDVCKYDHIQLHIDDDNVSYKWIRTKENLTHPLKKGWNYMRWPAHEGIMTNWVNSYGIRIVVETNSPASWTLGGINLEKSDKAQLLFIEDGGYKSFLTKGYPELKKRKIHTTWALTPGRLGEGEVITESDVDMLAQDYLSDFSFHSWRSEIHSTMSSDEVAENMIKCMRWLSMKGLQPRYWFRAAITQNNAPNHNIMQDYLEAYASPLGSAGLNIFPFKDPYNVGRINLHGASTAQIDSSFDTLKKTRSLMVCYTHGIGTGLQADMTQEHWDYFLYKIDEAIAEGWLESVTYDILRTRYERELEIVRSNIY